MWGAGAANGDGKFVGGVFVFLTEFLVAEVVGVDVLPGGDSGGGAANAVTVAMDGFTRSKVAERDFVARRNVVDREDALAIELDFGPGGDVDAGYRDVIGPVHANGGILRGGQFLDFEEHLKLFCHQRGTKRLHAR